ncbi:hypothetical protein [Candidatus Electronema sp. JC]|uniref:hypothetical protein n=1 Tax=Candidatus Electronema sp. JC TaxID=3401570 RepID=UPI003B43BD40
MRVFCSQLFPLHSGGSSFFLERRFAVFVNFCNSLISGIGKNQDMRLQSGSAFLEQLEIMGSSAAKIRRKNFSCLKISGYLNFMREAFFLSELPQLFFLDARQAAQRRQSEQFLNLMGIICYFFKKDEIFLILSERIQFFYRSAYS